MAMLFAATYPERTIALVLYGTLADYSLRNHDDPFMAEADAYLEFIDRNWGTIEQRERRSDHGARPAGSTTTGWLRGWPPTSVEPPARALRSP